MRKNNRQIKTLIAQNRASCQGISESENGSENPQIRVLFDDKYISAESLNMFIYRNIHTYIKCHSSNSIINKLANESLFTLNAQ